MQSNVESLEPRFLFSGDAGTVTGIAFNDGNGDGLKARHEHGIAGITIRLQLREE